MCDKFKAYIEELKATNATYLHGMAEDEFLDIQIDENGVGIDDGWTSFPYLPFNYCPICGEALKQEAF